MSISNNTPKLQSLLEKINALPEAGGVELPALTNEGTAADLLSGKQLIDQEGNIVTGTIETKNSLKRTANIVTAESGYYPSITQLEIPDATLGPVHASINNNGVISVRTGPDMSGMMPLDVTLTYQLPTQSAKTITPSTSEQTAVASGVYTTGDIKVSAVPTQTKTVTPTASSQIITPDSGKFLSNVTVNAMPTATQATPSISVNSNGLITASSTQSAGYVSAGTKSNTKQLTTQAAKTVTPSESSQTAVVSGVYTTGAVTVDAIPDSYIVDEEITTQDNLIAQITSALEGKASSNGGIILPTLSNPASASDLAKGKELIDGNGNVVVGTHICESGGGTDLETITLVNNTGYLVWCGATYLDNGESALITLKSNNGSTIIPIQSSNELTTLSCISTSGTVLGIFYNNVNLKVDGTTNIVSQFIAMPMIMNLISGSTVTIAA